MILSLEIKETACDSVLCAFGYQETVTIADENGALVSVPNSKSKEDFLAEKLLVYIRDVTLSHRAQIKTELARKSAEDEISSDFSEGV